jgi:multidrug efflux pump
MSRFFIDRPKLAWVVAIFILLAGLLAIPASRGAVSQRGAAADLHLCNLSGGIGHHGDGVGDQRHRGGLNGTKGLLYFDSSSGATGLAEITATFAPGTDPALAQVEVQNRIKKAEADCPHR